ncbi:SsgA family sporulation/cell division regulator [Nonomuraea sp. NPDC005650]|uniref:SsgA family sporulation/cell division regulator n=1 Tax=Nonomuraea sp. NPDC005650 TaxID=3157045 RepID=UPI0033BB00AC
MKKPVIVEEFVTLRPLEDGTPVMAAFRFDSTLPYEVSIAFFDGDLPVTYVIDRQTLTNGLEVSQTGHHVLVGPHSKNKLRTVLVFTPGHEQGGGASFGMYAAKRGLWRFIARTMAAVPFDREEDHLDLDAVAARLLGVS